MRFPPRQVVGTLIENLETVPKLEIRGRWDESLQVRHPDGSEETLWKFQPAMRSESRCGDKVPLYLFV